MVMMISATTEAPRAGAMASLCRMSPTATAARIASGAAIHSGTPAANRKKVVMPPIITNSPWAKFTTSEAL